MHKTYDITNLETRVNTNWYIRWHTTFSHNVTSALCDNVVSVPAENSFQPNHSMKHAEQKFKAMHPTHTPPLYVTCCYPHHRPSDGIAPQDGITHHAVLFPGTQVRCAWHSTLKHFPRPAVYPIMLSQLSLTEAWTKNDPYITTQANGTHTIARRMSDEIEI